MTVTIRAWHGDPQLKARAVATLQSQAAGGRLVQSAYAYYNPTDGFCGCLIGCLVAPALADQMGISLAKFCRPNGPAARLHYRDEPDRLGWWAAVEQLYGIPYHVVRCIGRAFEAFDEDAPDAVAWAVQAVEAIPVGADLAAILEPLEVSLREDRPYRLIDQLAAAPVPTSAEVDR